MTTAKLKSIIVLLSLGGAMRAARAEEAALYDTPEAAVAALKDATRSTEKGAIRKVFGDASLDLLSGDDVQDKADLASFAKRVAEAAILAKNEDGSMTLNIGRNGYPFPIPIVQKDGKWRFDTAAGKEEILNRRIGENELKTLAVCRAYVVAQREYQQADRDGDDVLEFAQQFASTAGKRDGLYWESPAGEPPSPLGPMVADARAEGYGGKADAGSQKPRPYHGYVYKILTRQGGKAPGGAFDYVINGNMVAGFALVAYPIDHGNSGIMTFIVNANGKVLEKDLGEKTAEIAAAIREYAPDDSWKPTED